MYTRLTSSGGPELERTFAVLMGKPRRELMFDADLVWVPAHGKMRLGGALTHFDCTWRPAPAWSIRCCRRTWPATPASA